MMMKLVGNQRVLFVVFSSQSFPDVMWCDAMIWKEFLNRKTLSIFLLYKNNEMMSWWWYIYLVCTFIMFQTNIPNEPIWMWMCYGLEFSWAELEFEFVYKLFVYAIHFSIMLFLITADTIPSHYDDQSLESFVLLSYILCILCTLSFYSFSFYCIYC